MSVSQMMMLGMRQRQIATTPRAQATAAGAPPSQVTIAMEKIAAFVPTEVIALYVTGLGIFAPTSAEGKWSIFFICALLIPAVMGIGYWENQKKGLPAPGGRIFGLLLAMAVVAFCAWASAMPNTPFLEFGDRATLVGGFVVLILSLLMPRIAVLLGAAPP
jgi:hypothetical protein